MRPPGFGEVGGFAIGGPLEGPAGDFWPFLAHFGQNGGEMVGLKIGHFWSVLVISDQGWAQWGRVKGLQDHFDRTRTFLAKNDQNGRFLENDQNGHF